MIPMLVLLDTTGGDLPRMPTSFWEIANTRLALVTDRTSLIVEIITCNVTSIPTRARSHSDHCQTPITSPAHLYPAARTVGAPCRSSLQRRFGGR